MKPANDPIGITEAEAAEIADECVKALNWQIEHFIVRKDIEAIATDVMVEAIRPSRPATLRLLLEIVDSGAPFKLLQLNSETMPALIPTTCGSIAKSLRMRGFSAEALKITEALSRTDPSIFRP